MTVVEMDISNDSVFSLKYGDTVSSLSKAAALGDLPTIKDLLKRGRLPHAVDNRGWSAIHSCVAANQLGALKLLLNYKKNKFLTNLRTWEGESPLIIAAKSDKISYRIVKTLLMSGADPNLTTNEGMTALHYVCKRKGNVDIAKLLFKYGSSVDAQEFLNGYTPMHFAIVEASDGELVMFLVDHCDINLADSDLETPLNKACFCDFLDAVKSILSKDTSSVNVIPQSGYSSLTAASLNGNLEMVKLLLDLGADTNIRGPAAFHRSLCQRKYLPIHSSVFVNKEVFKLFLKVTNPYILLNYENENLNVSLSLYTIMNAPRSEFFEVLLQHSFPPDVEALKTVTISKITNFILYTDSYSHGLFYQRLKLIFKYCSDIEPELVFQNLVHFIEEHKSKLVMVCEMFCLLADVGISSTNAYSSKCIVINLLQEMAKETDCKDRILEAIRNLSRPVLTLKQMSRVVGRRYIKSVVRDDWSAYIFIRDSLIPSSVKSYLWYEALT